MEDQKNIIDINDHDLLIRIDERTMKLEGCFTNHLKHHWAITLVLLVSILGLVTKIIFL